MDNICAAVAAYLQKESGVTAVEEGTRCPGVCPLLAVRVSADGTTLLDGGRQAERAYTVVVTAASDRDREEATKVLSDLVPVLLRGVPAALAEADGSKEQRMLHPLGIKTEGDKLTFSIKLCMALPKRTVPQGDPGIMETLHMEI